MLKILVITKRQYMKKDLLDDRFGRFRELPRELASKGHRVYGICLSYQYKDEGKVQDGPLEWESVNMGRLIFPGLFRFIRHASYYASRADVIWACSDSIYGIMGYMLSLKYKIPLVFDLYDNFEYYVMAKIPIVKQLYHWVIRKCAGVTCVSQPLARLIKGYRNKQGVHVLENAVRDDLFTPMDKNTCRDKLGLPQNGLIVGTAGALETSRGIQALLKAFHILSLKHPNLHLALAGPRDINIPVNKNIHDLGVLPLEKVPLLFNALDVAVICNRDDAFGQYCFPQKAVEIMACDVPLVATRVGSMKELLAEHPEWLFPPDDAGDLARVLEQRWQDKTTNYPLIANWSQAATRLEAIFNRLK
jgi:teichuronic acid biosynthesis glycosyltransferase TuaC